MRGALDAEKFLVKAKDDRRARASATLFSRREGLSRLKIGCNLVFLPIQLTVIYAIARQLNAAVHPPEFSHPGLLHTQQFLPCPLFFIGRRHDLRLSTDYAGVTLLVDGHRISRPCTGGVNLLGECGLSPSSRHAEIELTAAIDGQLKFASVAPAEEAIKYER